VVIRRCNVAGYLCGLFLHRNGQLDQHGNGGHDLASLRPLGSSLRVLTYPVTMKPRPWRHGSLTGFVADALSQVSSQFIGRRHTQNTGQAVGIAARVGACYSVTLLQR